MRKEMVTVKNEGKRAIRSDGMSRLSQRTMNNPQGKVHNRKEYDGMLRTVVMQCILAVVHRPFRTAYRSHFQGLSILLALLHPWKWERQAAPKVETRLPTYTKIEHLTTTQRKPEISTFKKKTEMLTNNSGLYKGRWNGSVEVDGPSFKSQLGQGICPFSKTSKPSLGPTQLPMQWVPEFFPGG